MIMPNGEIGRSLYISSPYNDNIAGSYVAELVLQVKLHTPFAAMADFNDIAAESYGIFNTLNMYTVVNQLYSRENVIGSPPNTTFAHLEKNISFIFVLTNTFLTFFHFSLYSAPFSASTISIFLFFLETIRLTKNDIPTVRRMLTR